MLKRAALALVIGSLVLGASASLPEHAGTEADPFAVYNTATVAIEWDAPGDGRVIVEAEVEVLDAAGQPAATVTITEGMTCDAGTCRLPIRALAEPLADGIYRFRVRLRDEYLNESAWSGWFWARKVWTELPAPGGGCRMVP
jgi:hypothetical protein